MKKKNFTQKKICLCLAFLFLVSSICIACGGPATSGQGKTGGILTIINRAGPTGLGGPAEVETGNQVIYTMHIIMDQIVRHDVEGKPVPELATSVTSSADGKTITFTLRKDVKFHDGTDFNAAAVKYHFDNMKYGKATIWNNLQSTTVIDDYTVRVVLKKFDVSFVYLLSRIYGHVGSPTAAQKQTTDTNRAKDHLIGTGPFKFVDWQRDVFVKTAKFDDYWQKGKPYLDGLEWKFITDPTTSTMSFKAGEAHVLYNALPKDAAELKKLGYKVNNIDSGLFYLVPDAVNADSPFSKVKVRQAIEYAIDRKAIASATGFGFQQPLTQICPSSVPTGYINNLAGREYNPNKAKELLKEAGYPNGFQTTVISSVLVDKDPIIAIQGYLKAVGIDASVDIQDDGKYRATALNGWKNALLFRDTGIDADFIITMYRYFDINSTYLKSMLRPPGLQDDINKANSEPDSQKRKDLTQKITRQLFEEAVAIPMWTKQVINVTQKSVNDAHFCEIDQFIWNPADTWISK